MNKRKTGFILSESLSYVIELKINNLLEADRFYLLPIEYENWSEEWEHPHCGSIVNSNYNRVFYKNKLITDKFYGKIFSSKREAEDLIYNQIAKLIINFDVLKNTPFIHEDNIEEENKLLSLF